MSTAPSSTTDTELERLKAVVNLEKAELSFLQASGKSLDEINAKRKVIQAALHDEAEYLRAQLEILKAEEVAEEDKAEHEAKIKALEEEILGLSTEWWNIQKNINDDLAKAEEERLKKLEEEKKLLEEQKKLQQEMFDTLKKQVDEYYAKLIEDKEKELTLEERILAVQQAEAALANTQRERTVRYYNAATGQWEWQANAKNVKSAQDALKKAQDDLNKYQRDQAWKEFKSAWEYVSEQIKAGAMTFQEAYDYMYEAMKRIQDTYGVDLGFVLDDSIGGFKNLTYGIDGLTQEVANSLGASVGVLNERLKQYETAVGAFKDAFDEAAEKVRNGEMSMEDAYSYLRDRAKDIADKYGIDMTGALEEAIAGMDKTNMSIDELWKAVIINLMKVNSARWFDATDEEKAQLHAQNEYLGKLIGATYDPSGYWYLNGSQLYGSQKGVDVSGKTGYGESVGGVAGAVGGAGTAIGGVGYSGASEVIAKNGKYYDTYGNAYDTLEAAIAGNGSTAAFLNALGKHRGVIGGVHMTDWMNPEEWAAESGLTEADQSYVDDLISFFNELESGASLEDLKAKYNNLYSSSSGSHGSFSSFRGEDGTTGFAKIDDWVGNYTLIHNNYSAEKLWPGTLVQDLYGNRYVVGEDGHSLEEVLPAWYLNEDGSYTPGYDYGRSRKINETETGTYNGHAVGAEDIAAGEAWAAMMNLGNSDMALAGADAMSYDSNTATPVLNDSSTTNNQTYYQFGGLTIGEETANVLTVAELARLAGDLGKYPNPV